MARVQIPDDPGFSLTSLADQDYRGKVADALSRGATTDEVYSLARTAGQRAIIDDMVQKPQRGVDVPEGREFDDPPRTMAIEGDQSFLEDEPKPEPSNDPNDVIFPEEEETQAAPAKGNFLTALAGFTGQETASEPDAPARADQPPAQPTQPEEINGVLMPPEPDITSVMFPPEPDTSNVQFPKGLMPPPIAPTINAQEAEEDNSFVKNLAVSFGVGSNAALKTLANLYGTVTGDIKDPNSVASRLAQQGESGMEYYGDMKSDYLKLLEQARSEKVEATEGEWNKLGVALWETVSSANLLASTLTEQVPSFVGPGVAGRLAYKLGTALNLTPKVSGALSTVTGVGAGGSMDAGEAAGEAFEGLLELPEDLWEQNPAYRELKGPLGPEGAKAELALEYTREAGAKAGMFSVATGALPWARTVEKYLGKGATDLPGGRIGRGVRGAAGESLQESGVEGVNAVSVNQALQNVDPNQETFEGAGEGAALGFVGGTAFGGAAGLASPARRLDDGTPVDPEAIQAELDELNAETVAYNNDVDETAAEAAADVAAAGGDALDQQNAQTRIYNEFPQRKVATAEDLGVVFDDNPPPEAERQPRQRTEPRTQYDPNAKQYNPNAKQPKTETSPERDLTPLEDEIEDARAFGDEEKVARLSNAKRMYQLGQQMRDQGNEEAATRMFERANTVLKSYDVRPQDPSSNYPVPAETQGELEQAEQAQATEAREPSQTFENPPQPGPRRIGRENVIYGEEPEDVTARRERFARTTPRAMEGQIGGQPSTEMTSPIAPKEEMTDDDYTIPEDTDQDTFGDRDYPPPPQRGENTFSDRDYPRLPSDPALSTGRPKGRSGSAPPVVEDQGQEYGDGPFTVGDMESAGAVPMVADMIKSVDYQRREKGRDIAVEQMSPDEYLKRAAEGLAPKGSETPEQIIAGRARNTENIQGMVKEMQSGKKFAAPYLDYIGGRFGQEGMHRALAAKAMGLESIPVVIMSDYSDGSVQEGESQYDVDIDQQQDGSIIVRGDVAEIRARLPKAMRGTVVDGGLKFARARANQIREALRSEDTAPEPSQEPEIGNPSDLVEAIRLAKSQSWGKGKDLKAAIQERVRAEAAQEGTDLSDNDYLAKRAVEDALESMKSNKTAIGWYDRTVSEALRILSVIHPEIATDPESEFAFKYALAVTSNGLKVNKNFEIAEEAYKSWKETGSMPTDVGSGPQGKAMNKAMALYNERVAELGPEAFRTFMTTRMKVRDVEAITGKKVSGEKVDTDVFGAVIIGPKIGNGFLMNLYGEFGQLTMDRWLMATWGRWNGTLLEDNTALVGKARARIKDAIRALSPEQKRRAKAIAGRPMIIGQADQVAAAINKASSKDAPREELMATPELDELRLAGNQLTKLLDGQKLSPSNGTERNKIRRVFSMALDELQSRDGLDELTMADLQAVLWYSEKRLYDAAKVENGKPGYEPEESPDYANAAAAVARQQGISESDIRRARSAGDAGRGSDDAGREAGQQGRGDADTRGQDRGGVLSLQEEVQLDTEADPYAEAETRPGTTEAQKKAGRSALDALETQLTGKASKIEGVDGEISILGARIYKNFKEGKPNQLLGQPLVDSRDLASLAQVYRDPRFETFRYIAVKDGQVIAESAVTSRLPGMVSFGSAEGARRFAKDFSRKAELAGATEVYMLHNHPSGNSTPSQADLEYTFSLAAPYFGDIFAGHVVIDTNEYSVIDAFKNVETTQDESLGSVDFNSNPERPHDYLNQKINGPVVAGMMGRALASEDNYVIVMTGRSDSTVAAITSVPAAYIEKSMRTQAGRARLRAQMRILARETGAAGHLFIVMPKNGDLYSGRGLLRYATDVIDANGQALSSMGDMPRARNPLMFSDTARGIMIEDRLEGMPETVEVDGRQVEFQDFEPAVEAARKYAESAGIDYNPPTQYARIDRARATKIAREYDILEHAPNNPEVKAAYDAMIKETMAQFQAVLDTGLEIQFIKGDDPYGNPRNAVLDVIENNHLWVFSTRDGFGSDQDFDPVDNPLLGDTEFTTADGDQMLANDVFRVVHDYFGHIKHGNGFRARGEEAAWQAHAAMYTPLARRAMTTETRGQNSWVNFGPYAEYNRTASGGDTVYADQKVGLLPIWVSEEGRLSERNRRFDQRYTDGLEGAVIDGRLQLSHFSRAKIDRTQPWKAGTGLDRKVSGRRYLPAVSYFGITEANEDGYRRESGLGEVETKFSIEPTQLYPADTNPEGLWKSGDYAGSIKRMKAAGFSGFRSNNKTLGKVAVIWDPLISDDSLEIEEPGDEYNRTEAGLYSKLERAIAQARIPGLTPSKRNPEGSIRADSWMQYLRNRGIKQEEWLWTGMRDFLNANPRQRYTRDDLLAEAAERRIELGGVVAGGKSTVKISVSPRGYPEWLKTANDEDVRRVVRSISMMEDFDKTTQGIKSGNLNIVENAVFNNGVDTGIRVLGGPGTYWSVYRKADITMLAMRQSSMAEAMVQARAHIEERADREPSATRWEDYVEPGDYSNYQEIKVTLDGTEAEFDSGAHFSEKNILGFLRTTDRDEGRRFFIEELQSDWHQKGREKGYVSTKERAQAIKSSEDATRRLNDSEVEFRRLIKREVLDRAEEFGIDRDASMAPLLGLYDDIVRNEVMAGESIEQAQRITRRFLEFRLNDINDVNGPVVAERAAEAIAPNMAEAAYEIAQLAGSEARLRAQANFDVRVPDAPFKDDAWINLMAKRAMLEAAKGDYESISWMTSAAMQSRWSDEYAELYTNIYDKKVPAIIRRLSGQQAKKQIVVPEDQKFRLQESYLVQGTDIRPLSNYTSKDGPLTDDQLQEIKRRFKQDFDWRKDVRVIPGSKAVEIAPVWFGAQVYWESPLPDAVKSSIRDEGLPLFRVESAGRGRTVEQVRADIEGLVPGVNYEILATQDDLPANVRETMRQQGIDRISGYYTRSESKVTLVADALKDRADAQKTLLHEAVGHLGVERVLGAQMDEFLGEVRRARGTDAVIDAAWDYVMSDYADAPPVVQAAEVVARIAESNPRHTLVQRAVQWMRQLLRRMGFRVMFTNSDIIEVLRRAKQSYADAPVPTPQITPQDDDEAAFRSEDEDRDEWRERNRVAQREGRVPEVRAAIEDYVAGNISQDEYINTVRSMQAIQPIGEVPKPATMRLMKYALKSDQTRKATNRKDAIPEGTRVGARLDIPAYNDYDVWVASIHDGEKTNTGSVLAYTPSAILSDVEFTTNPKAALGVARGKSKSTFARMHGSWKQHTPAQAAARAKQAMGSPDWVQVGMNPFRHSYFYDKATGDPVIAADEVIQVGALVMAKGVVYTEPSDPRFEVKGEDIMFRVGGAPPTEPGKYVASDTVAAQGIRWIQDRFRVLKDLQTDIQDKGGVITNENNAYLAETLFHGKAEEDLRQMTELYVEPLGNKMAKYGISSEALDQYLYARHAPERNAQIAKINPSLPDGGSGMTNVEAGTILARVRAEGKAEQMQELAHLVYNMLEMQRTMILDQGLDDDGTIAAWKSSYRYYVPLKGWAHDTREQGKPKVGSGFSIRGKESKRAMGRTSKAASPLGYAIGDTAEKIIRARKNEVGNAFLKLLEDNPDPESWEIYTDDNPEPTRRIVKRRNPETGEIEERVVDQPMAMAMQGDQYFTTKRGGKTYYMKIADRRLVNAMKGLGPDSTGAFIRTLAGINRVLSALNTSYNPEFVVTNFARDVQTAILNLKAEQSLGVDSKTSGEKIAYRTAKDAVPAIWAILASLRGKKLTGRKNAELQKYFQEFREAGAKTGYFDMKDLDGQAKAMDRLVTMAKGGFKGTGMLWAKNSFELVEHMNQAVENGVRLAAYMNARKAGIPEPQAASLAKDMTVNFNRRGEIGTTMNALYMFANASVQGTANFARTMLTLRKQYGEDADGNITREYGLNNAQKIAGAMMVGSYFLGMLARAVAGDDEDEVNWYEKVPDYVKERNIVIMKSTFGGEQDGTYWKIPLPYGYNAFHVMGSSMEAVTNGNTRPSEAAINVALALAGSFSPIGFQTSETLSGVFMKNAAPTVTKPFVDVVMNENFMGSPIYKENFPFGVQKPNSALSRPSTPKQYEALATWLNEVTGGSQYRPGGIDINPDVMRHFVDFYGGAAYNFLGSKVPDVVYRSVTGQVVEQFQVPFIGRISGKVRPYADTSTFYERRNEVQQIAEEFKNMPAKGRRDFMQKFGPQLRMQGRIKSVEKLLKVQRQLRDRVYEMELTPKEKDKRLREIQGRMKSIVADFNRAYNKAVKDR